MSYISKEVIKDIIEQNNIVDVIGNFIPLNKQGNNYKSTCPFHNDHDPSFSVSAEKQIYKCFSCGVNGNVVTFIIDYKKINFLKAIEILAKRINYKITINSESKTFDKHSIIYSINKDAMIYYKNNLLVPKYKFAFEYLNKVRKLDYKEINNFNLGYASTDNNLYQFLISKDYKEFDILESRLFKKHQNKLVDFFQNRIIFPILDIDGNVLGFSGRVLNENKRTKYLNSPSSEIFEKNKILYNLNNAKIDINKQDSIFIVEGFFDVIALAKIGINNSIATMGINLSMNHINIIKKHTNNIVIFMDNDSAGINATIIITSSLLKCNFNVYNIYNNSKKDADELLKESETKLSNMLRDSKLLPIDYLIKLFNNNIKNTEFLNKIIKFKNILISSINDQSKKILWNTKFNKNIAKTSSLNNNTNSNNVKYNINSNIYIPDHFSLYYNIIEQLILSIDAYQIYIKNIKKIKIENQNFFNIIKWINLKYQKNNNLKNIDIHELESNFCFDSMSYKIILKLKSNLIFEKKYSETRMKKIITKLAYIKKRSEIQDQISKMNNNDLSKIIQYINDNKFD